MRKIASNYIFLPGYPLTKNGYIIWDNHKLIDVIDTNEIIKEFHSLEFYGGMIIDGSLLDYSGKSELAGKPIVPFLDTFYSQHATGEKGLAIIKKADLSQLIFKEDSTIERLI